MNRKAHSYSSTYGPNMNDLDRFQKYRFVPFLIRPEIFTYGLQVDSLNSSAYDQGVLRH